MVARHEHLIEQMLTINNECSYNLVNIVSLYTPDSRFSSFLTYYFHEQTTISINESFSSQSLEEVESCFKVRAVMEYDATLK
jgi:hypothetical protein